MDNAEIQILNDFESFLSFRPTWIFRQMLLLYHDKIAYLSGNQSGKTSGISYSYVLRLLGTHPIPYKNVNYFECPNGHMLTIPAPAPGFDKAMWPKMKPGDCWMVKDRNSFPFLARFPHEDLKCPECKEDINIHKRQSQIFRFCSENLPTEPEGKGVDSAETKNRTYPELKKWLPPFLVKKDLTHRNMNMAIKDPLSGYVFGKGERKIHHKGRDVIFEFMSYSQSVQSGAGAQRMSIFCDEEPNYAFYEEQKPRLMAEEGDFLLALTPANHLSWAYTEFYENADLHVRTRTIREFLSTQGEKNVDSPVIKTGRRTGIAVLQSATDDNPTLKKSAIESMLVYDDPDTIATRRYGIFRQATGRIFKDFDHNTHVIDPMQYFPDGRLPHEWVHGRGVDVHPQTPWACGCASLSPADEMYIWYSANYAPDRFTTLDILTNFFYGCEDYKFYLSLVDPEAETIKKDTVSVYDDMNRITSALKREGIGTGGYWQKWNTKNDYGRDQIKLRLKNSLLVGRPMNNVVIRDGQRRVLPTIWICEQAKAAIEFMSKWSWEQRQRMDGIRDEKNTPQQKWSHLNMVWEALLKHPGFVCRGMRSTSIDSAVKHNEGKQYFRARGR